VRTSLERTLVVILIEIWWYLGMLQYVTEFAQYALMSAHVILEAAN
jgi:hypothetical protein